MDITRICIKHKEPFKVFFDIDIGGTSAGRIIMEVSTAAALPGFSALSTSWVWLCSGYDCPALMQILSGHSCAEMWPPRHARISEHCAPARKALVTRAAASTG